MAGADLTQPRDYALINAVWASLLAGVLATTHAEGPPVREPLVQEDEPGRPPKGRRLRYVAGELLTCSRCLGTWSALGLVGLRAARPREARLVAGVLATSAVNDFLQCGFSWATTCANRSATAPPPSSP